MSSPSCVVCWGYYTLYWFLYDYYTVCCKFYPFVLHWRDFQLPNNNDTSKASIPTYLGISATEAQLLKRRRQVVDVNPPIGVLVQLLEQRLQTLFVGEWQLMQIVVIRRCG